LGKSQGRKELVRWPENMLVAAVGVGGPYIYIYICIYIAICI
jgi:hypothetical protein